VVLIRDVVSDIFNLDIICILFFPKRNNSTLIIIICLQLEATEYPGSTGVRSYDLLLTRPDHYPLQCWFINLHCHSSGTVGSMVLPGTPCSFFGGLALKTY
jgi:hypothetical protein